MSDCRLTPTQIISAISMREQVNFLWFSVKCFVNHCLSFLFFLFCFVLLALFFCFCFALLFPIVLSALRLIAFNNLILLISCSFLEIFI